MVVHLVQPFLKNKNISIRIGLEKIKIKDDREGI
jgi:hypothetical protein